MRSCARARGLLERPCTGYTDCTAVGRSVTVIPLVLGLEPDSVPNHAGLGPALAKTAALELGREVVVANRCSVPGLAPRRVCAIKLASRRFQSGEPGAALFEELRDRVLGRAIRLGLLAHSRRRREPDPLPLECARYD